MPGDSVPDEAARLEAALERIGRAAAQAKAAMPDAALHDAAVQVTTRASVPHAAEIAARLDGLIAELRGVLGTDA